MKDLLNWLSGNPIKAICFSVFFTILATCLAFRQDWLAPIVTLYATGLALLFFTIQNKKLLTICLLVGLASSREIKAQESAVAQPASAAGGCAIIVVVAGGVVVYQLVKFCQKKFPKNTNAPSSMEFGASWNYDNTGSCYEPLPGTAQTADLNTPTTFTLDVSLVETGEEPEIRTKLHAVKSDEFVLNWFEYQRQISAMGLCVTGVADYSQCFMRYGQPCSASEVPIAFDLRTKRVVLDLGGRVRQISVERSADLKDWTPLFSTDASSERPLRIVDTTPEKSMFYRVKVK